MKITATILLFFLIILVDGEERAHAAIYSEAQTEQQAENQEGAVVIAIKANEIVAAKKATNEVEMDKVSLAKALESYKLDNGGYLTTEHVEQIIQALTEKPTIDQIPRRERQEGYHDSNSDVLNSVADNKYIDGEPVITLKKESIESAATMGKETDVLNSAADNKYVDGEPVITMKQESKESSATMGKETEATSTIELIKTEILIFAVTFAAVLAVIFDKQLLVILKLIFGKLKQIARNKAADKEKLKKIQQAQHPS